MLKWYICKMAKRKKQQIFENIEVIETLDEEKQSKITTWINENINN